MPERDGYIPGVPCWVEASEPGPEAALDFYDADAAANKAAELGGRVIVPPFDAPWSTSTYTIRVSVLADPQGATFAASKFIARRRDLGQGDV
jgi:hypothetical protein